VLPNALGRTPSWCSTSGGVISYTPQGDAITSGLTLTKNTSSNTWWFFGWRYGGWADYYVGIGGQ